MNLLDLSLKVKGFPIMEAEKRLREIQEIPEENFSDYVQQARKDIVKFHLEHNKFYRELAGKQSITNWQEVPVLTKSHLQQPLKLRLSKGFTTKNVYINKTSGSGGHPFIFAKDRYCHALTWAVIKDRFLWHDIDLKTSLQARFYGIPLDTFGYFKERLKDTLSGRHRFPIFDLSDKKLELFLKKFTTTKFDYINGYTSSIVLFAKYLKKKGVILKDVCPSLKLCVVTSEMLFDTDKDLLEEQLGVPVVNEYGASELDLIAFTNPEGELLLNSETLFIEILDEQGEEVPQGTPGRIVITSLYNKAHPFIRYDIGDTGILSETCTLKRPVLSTLIGRTNDVALLSGGKIVPGLTFYYITKNIIEDSGNVKEFVISQTATDAFEISYVSDKPLSEKEKQQIKKSLDLYLERDLNLRLKRHLVLDRSNRGKLKQFKRDF